MRSETTRSELDKMCTLKIAQCNQLNIEKKQRTEGGETSIY